MEDLLQNSYEKPYLEFSDSIFHALKTLLEFNYKYIYHSPKKAANEEKSLIMFKMLFEKYQNDFAKKEGDIYDLYASQMIEDYTNKNNCGKIVVKSVVIKPANPCNYWVFGLLLIQRFHCGEKYELTEIK